MSEKSKGNNDTYATAAGVTPTRIPKNPLLSASVTGLSLDDFPNKPLILPPAPPIVHAPSPTASPPLLAAIGTETTAKKLVTVGKSSNIDSESLDEINLNTTATTVETHSQQIDANFNTLLTDANQQEAYPDSILSQAASSFSALPSVASTVFSTFSKRLYAGSTSRELTPDLQPPTQPENVNVYNTSQQAPLPVSVNPTTFYASPTNNNNLLESNSTIQSEQQAPVEPPKFYTPAQVLPTTHVQSTPPLAPAGQNTYRLSAKKKYYAPIPGLSGEGQQLPTAATALNQFVPTIAAETFNVPPASAFTQPTESDEQRKGGLSGILQNISGLVQSATSTLQQSSKPTEQLPPQEQALSNYFGTAANVSPYTQSVPPGFTQVQLVGNQNQPKSQTLFGTSESTQHEPPPTTTQVPILLSKTHTTAAATSQPILASPPGQEVPPALPIFFDPTTATDARPLKRSQEVYEVATGLKSSFSLPTTFPNTERPLRRSQEIFDLVTGAELSAAEALVPTVPTTNFFNTNPTNVSLFTPQPVAHTAENNFTAGNLPLPPPTAVAKPPTISAGPSTFRLQKGTKLYKNPLTSTELTAAVNAPLLTPQIPATNYFIPSQVQPLVPTQEVSVDNNSGTAVNFFAPPETKLNEGAIQLAAAQQQALFGTSVQPQVQLLKTIPQLQQHNIFSPPQVQLLKAIPPQQQPLQAPLQPLFPFAAPTQEFQEQLHLNPADLAKEYSPQKPSEKRSQVIAEALALEQSKDYFDPFPITSPNTVDNLSQQAAESSAEFGIKDILNQKVENQSIAALLEEQIIEPVATGNIERNEVDPLEETIKKLVLEPTVNRLTTDTEPLIPTDDAFLTDVELQTSYKPEEATAPPVETEITELNINANVQPPPPPAIKSTIKTEANPFRRNSGASVILPTKSNIPVLASFFTPATVDADNNSDGDFNIFSAENSSLRQGQNQNNFSSFFDQSLTLVPAQVLSQEVGESSSFICAEGVPPPIGFDNIVADVKEQTTKSNTAADTNTINFFNQTSDNAVESLNNFSEKQEVLQTQNTKIFFDNFVTTAPATIVVQSTEQQENQRLQNFFNNPPLSESGDTSNKLSYALLHSGVALGGLHSNSSSNIVEPPSSACSSFTVESKQNSEVNLQQSFETNNNKSVTNNNIDKSITEKYYADLPEAVLKDLNMANLLSGEKGSVTDTPPARVVYTPAVKHWFYRNPVPANKFVWTPFSHYDSALLETSFESDDKIVAVEGGRYDVDIFARRKVPVYWEGVPIDVRRCSWFYKGTDSKYIPYEEETADLLEAEYKQASESGEWHKKIMLARGEQVLFHGPTVMVHFQHQQNSDAWGGTSQASTRPRVVKRDLEEFTIEQGECQKVDHLLFMVHGIGSACDLRMRTVEEVVDDFRSIAAQLVQSHYKNSCETCLIGRVEVLPISWHGQLHSTEIDEKLKSITLESIPKLRNFTNDTLLDVLFYTSPTYCQKIMNTVAASLNSVYIKYRQRHPEFNGGVSLAGHSLGSLILFDLLCHQESMKETEESDIDNSMASLSPLSAQESSMSQTGEVAGSKQVSYTVGPAGTGQPFIHYPQLVFQPKKFFALGSPIGMYVTIRGIDKLGLDFRLPTCPGFYNIFHPFDPVAYRIEALVNPDMSAVRPVLIPHHKGRKRLHLEFKETMTRVSADLRQRFVDTFKNTLGSVNFLGHSSKQTEREEEENMASEVNKVIELQTHLEAQQMNLSTGSQISLRSRADSTSSNAQSEHDLVEIDFSLGKLNDSKRIDYVLQEAPLEFFNEYLFALSSHVCYWDSADTILFVMKEIYSGLGVSPDSQVPQQSMTIERPNSRNSFSQAHLNP